MPRLHLVDGTYELFRAHFSPKPGHKAADGREVKATAGMVSSLLALLFDPDERVTHIAVAFDNPIRSFRNDLFDGYKSDDGVPDEIKQQFDLAEAAVKALGVVTWSMDEFEADDALATAAHKFAGKVEQVRILTPDKDLAQCVRGQKVVQVDRMRQRVIDEDAVALARGVPPVSIPDLLALVGDTSDGIPGLKGFGAKSASMLLSEHRHLEQIPQDLAEWKIKPRGAARLSQTLEANRESAVLYKELATLRLDVPIKENLRELAWKGVPKNSFHELCDELALDRIRSRPERWVAG